MYKRVFLIVIDSVGCGELPDAAAYGDEGANTIKHISEATNGIYLPNMEKLGYGHITDIMGVSAKNKPVGNYSKMKELSVGKDTMTGHWELMGLRITEPFITFTDTGFPKELIDELSERTGRKIVGNKASSGTVILDEYGEHQLKTGDLIVYTSADSVLQIAAHEEKIGLDELYKACEIAREMTLREEWKLGRIIARPFLGDKKGSFLRTPNRHDYALKPFADTVLVHLKNANKDVVSFGKINDIYDTEGITESYKQTSNHHGMENYINYAKKDFDGLAYLNLVDFDALYGHRRNPEGYKESLEEFDIQLGELMNELREDDLLIITADHGNDPTAPGTDHTREYVPLLVFNKKLEGNELEVRESFADIGATIAENFKVEAPQYGKSFLKELK
ncbi:phosphopentomutase [Candidatus Izimaplasma bacterium ZiA1]|uniref:phosphopentomutase n=1 Tax=Candidatus Izimoplasma sp. ZiA1 TaxID=2024899 RepID=UPI000BAA4E11|nr:phosphopentomutase [Candidatus Izimaplasma bacterium ZiA1]